MQTPCKPPANPLETTFLGVGISVGEIPTPEPGLPPIEPAHVECWVYLITDDRGHAKIGVTRRPKVRLVDLQVGNPHKLRIERTWRCESVGEAFALEQEALEQCRRSRLCGEWVRAPNLAKLAARIERLHQGPTAGERLRAERWAEVTERETAFAAEAEQQRREDAARG